MMNQQQTPPDHRSNRRQSLAVYSKQLSLSSVNSIDDEDKTMMTANTVDTKSVHTALKMMRAPKTEKLNRKERKQKKKEMTIKRKQERERLENKPKLYAQQPVIKLNSVASLKNQAAEAYYERIAKERSERYTDLILSANIKKDRKFGFNMEVVEQIVEEEQEIIDRGIDINTAMALVHKEDKERYKSAREKYEEKKKEEARERKAKAELLKKREADRESREIHMPI